MPRLLAALTIVLLLAMVLTRIMYVAFALILIGQFLVFSNWILLLYIGAATWLFHRQVLREEEYLKSHYGAEYVEYCQRVRRYF